MTDDTGLLEHSFRRIPRRTEGYTTDDNARALWACVEWMDREPAADRGEQLARVQRLADVYLSFLLWAQRKDGHFHNNFAYDRRPEPEEPSDDCMGRALWALALASVRLPDSERRLVAGDMFVRSVTRAKALSHPRGWAYSLAACSFLVRAADTGAIESEPIYRFVRSALPPLITLLETKLLHLYHQHSQRDWRWFEPVMTYGNGLLPWSLLCSGSVTGNAEAVEVGRASLDFLISKMTGERGFIRPVGNQGWCTRQSCSQWDQQPLEVMKLALAAAEAYVSLGKPWYLAVVEKCRNWFYGENDLGVPVANADEGSCCDGLTPDGVNFNRGAESTLSYLLTEIIHDKAKAGMAAMPLSQDPGGERRLPAASR